MPCKKRKCSVTRLNFCVLYNEVSLTSPDIKNSPFKINQYSQSIMCSDSIFPAIFHWSHLMSVLNDVQAPQCCCQWKHPSITELFVVRLSFVTPSSVNPVVFHRSLQLYSAPKSMWLSAIQKPASLHWHKPSSHFERTVLAHKQPFVHALSTEKGPHSPLAIPQDKLSLLEGSICLRGCVWEEAKSRQYIEESGFYVRPL